jgi:DNA-binding IclR family transcriptional regulator
VDAHPGLTVDGLLVLHHLTRHREISAREAADLCQRPIAAARELLARLAAGERLLETGGPSGRGRYYRLSLAAYTELGDSLAYHVDSRLAQENVKGRILTALKQAPLSNADIREITQLGRDEAKRLMAALREEGLVELQSVRKAARWHRRLTDNL